MIEILTTKDVLSAILCQCRQQEQFPEPFRLQEKVVFLVSFETYVDYIKTLTDDTCVQLTFAISYLRNLTVAGNERAYDAFLADMAFAICKEISYSEEWQKPASLILPTAEGVSVCTVDDFSNMYSESLTCGAELIQRVISFGYPMKKKLTERNTVLLHVAVLLYHLSKLGRRHRSVISIIP